MQIIRDRRALHRIPELDKTLPKTMQYLRQSLEGLNCRLFDPTDDSLCAFFDFGAQSAIAFRADCDALPIQEQSNTKYCSAHEGKMHACGHDGHMAILLELARRLNNKKSLRHNVLLIFQSAEETTGGALPICQSGIFDTYQVKAIFGLHLWPQLTAGIVHSRQGELMARASEIDIDIYGRSAHIAKAAEGLDALTAGADFLRRAYALEQTLPENIYRLLKFGHMESGTVRNALSAHTRIEGSLRAFQDETFNYLRDGLYAIASDIEAETGCTVKISLAEGLPPVMNPAALYQEVQGICEFVPLDAPSMTAEDFSWYQRFIPGMFFFLGLGDVNALHTAEFDFNDEILLKGADFFEALAENFQ